MDNRLAQLAREYSHKGAGRVPTKEEIQSAIDVGMGRVPRDIAYGEKPLAGGFDIGEVGGIPINATDLIGAGIPSKLAMGAKMFAPALMAALGGTAIASKASQGAKLNALANMLRKERGILAGTGKQAKTEYELAHEVAQRNAALPVEQGGLGLPANNTAMDRAKAMGFDTPAYHGTNADIQAFDPAMSGDNVQYMKGVFTADNPELAGNFGDSIYPLLQNTGVTVRDKVAARRAGKPSPIVDTIYNKDAGILVTNNPSNIRSRFAAFDPMQRNSANILSGIAAGTIGLPLLYDSTQGYQNED